MKRNELTQSEMSSNMSIDQLRLFSYALSQSLRVRKFENLSICLYWLAATI